MSTVTTALTSTSLRYAAVSSIQILILAIQITFSSERYGFTIRAYRPRFTLLMSCFLSLVRTAELSLSARICASQYPCTKMSSTFKALVRPRFDGRCRRLISSQSDANNSVDGSPYHPPRRYFDLKRFREYLKRHKQYEEEQEYKLLQKQHAKPSPDAWDVPSFLSSCGVSEAMEDVLPHFPTWTDLVTASRDKLTAIEALSVKQRDTIMRKINLFNHGLWPDNSYNKFIEDFQAPPLANEGKPWTDVDDKKLLELAEYYDINFGDPWLYISWKMQREFVDVFNRYVDIKWKPEYRAAYCDIQIIKASRPLLMNRYFKIDPPFLYIIPSQANFPLSPAVHAISIPSSSEDTAKEHELPNRRSNVGWLPEKFHKYRRPEIFRNFYDFSACPPVPLHAPPPSASVALSFCAARQAGAVMDPVGNARNSKEGCSVLDSEAVSRN